MVTHVDAQLTDEERDKIALDDTRDGMLFRFWIRAASYPGGWPNELMNALTHCTQPGDYRVALTLLARRKGVNLP